MLGLLFTAEPSMVVQILFLLLALIIASSGHWCSSFCTCHQFTYKLPIELYDFPQYDQTYQVIYFSLSLIVLGVSSLCALLLVLGCTGCSQDLLDISLGFLLSNPSEFLCYYLEVDVYSFYFTFLYGLHFSRFLRQGAYRIHFQGLACMKMYFALRLDEQFSWEQNSRMKIRFSHNFKVADVSSSVTTGKSGVILTLDSLYVIYLLSRRFQDLLFNFRDLKCQNELPWYGYFFIHCVRYWVVLLIQILQL